MGCVPPGYVNMHTPLSNIQCVNNNAYAKDCRQNEDYVPDLITDDVTSAGLYTLCCMVMQLKSMLQTREVN